MTDMVFFQPNLQVLSSLFAFTIAGSLLTPQTVPVECTKMSSISSSPSFARLLIVIGFLGQVALGAIGDIFNVQPGTTEGGCDDHTAALDRWFEDSQTLIKAAAVGVAATDTDSLGYLNGFFSIKPAGSKKEVTRTFTINTGLNDSQRC